KNDNPAERFNPSTLVRIDVLNVLKNNSSTPRLIVTYPEALCEKVVSEEELSENTSQLKINTKLDTDFIIEFLNEYKFERVDFVNEAGCFSVRGGIIDIFSYANKFPYRIELLDDKIESIREFDPESQLSIRKLNAVTIIPNLEKNQKKRESISFLKYISPETIIFYNNLTFVKDALKKHLTDAKKIIKKEDKVEIKNPEQTCITTKSFIDELKLFTCVDFNESEYFKSDISYNFNIKPQTNFNKNFDIFGAELLTNQKAGIKNYIFSESSKQIELIYAIFEDKILDVKFVPVYQNLHAGFIDKDAKIACFAEHEIFKRYQKVPKTKVYSNNSTLSLKNINELKQGDYITHINHGIGQFSGLEKIENNGRKQEAIRINYKGGDLLYVSIHSLYKISRYTGKEGNEPKLHRLGSNSWDNLKQKAKKKVKDIARDLIKLYAKRKSEKGFSFTPDTYLQTELEASFMYEDTPDQASSTEDVKRDMERANPMDRLICGDVGYGKTEIAIRAAFKAVADNKQVAILVPTTILAFQHYQTFTERLKEFPANINYLSRFKTAKQQEEIKDELEDGKIDIVIGTHKLLGKGIRFRRLGLLIIDEEQKFGVTAKEKLRSLKTNVDTLSLTATPIPRTLQFSLMGVRDLSIINTAPANRQPTDTFIKTFDREVVREAIEKEMERDGQVFFVHNRIKDLEQIESIIRKEIPHVKMAIAHGRMQSKNLEEIMLNFIGGYYDVLLSTNIIESGLDIPNANTIIINDAQNFGLSDLYQMRGRVGRSNIKAYCFLLIPSFTAMTTDARKRLAAIEEFTDLGSGFHIAMRDLDIRGAGNLLGAEQSGFISDIGLDMYKKILEEAIFELRQNEFADLFKERQDLSMFRECQVDTDLEVLIPDEYISSVEERLNLYSKLNKINDDKKLQEFEKELIDRFGKIPYQTNDLLDLMRLKWEGQKLGIKKIFLKRKSFKAIFPYDVSESEHFQSNIFGKLLTFAKSGKYKCEFNEKTKGLELAISNVEFVDEALDALRMIKRSI
ncbi:MAG: transcription-repair coupling factor, partial [Bacteroidota bacterium]|nr:transcription-repair coupling factor [Bacteroidota bacterium]